MGETHPVYDESKEPEATHEASGVSFAGVMAFSVSLIVLTIALQVGLWLLFRTWYSASEAGQPAVSPLAGEDRGRPPPKPVLEGFEEPRRLAERRQAVQKPPDDYAWADRDQGIVKVPVKEAMRRLAGKLPVRPADERKLPWREARRPGDASSGRVIEGGQQ